MYSRTPLSYFCNASIPERLRESYYQHHQGMIDKRSESNISTYESKKAAVCSHIGSRTAACLLILYSFLSLGVRTTPDHKSGRAHLQNVASRGAKLKFWKIEFLQLFHSKSGALYVKTPHFRAVFFSVASFINTFWSCWPDSNWWPHPYQEIFGVFYNNFRLFLVVSIPNNIVSITFAKCSLRCFHACLWWNGGQPAICVDSACANRIDSAPQITPQFLRKSI